MLSWSSYSQQDTTKVVLPTKVARLAYQDLIRYDGCKEELKLTQDKLSKVEERESHKDTIIGLLNEKDKNNQFIINEQTKQLDLSLELSNSLEKELKGQKNKTLFWKIGAFAGVLITYLIVK
jgi:hypothetical protein